jgi:hypothetical protein
MRTLFSKFVAFAIVFGLATGSAQAALWSLNYDGLTATGSTSTDGTAISNGTAFSVHAIFSDTTGRNGGTGQAYYQPSAINLTVGGTSYSVTAGIPGKYITGSLDKFIVGLADPSNFIGAYRPSLDIFSEYFYPSYKTATPALDAAHPSATIFSGFSHDYFHSLTFSTAEGSLKLVYDNALGVNASITAVPEPEEWAMMLVGSGLISWQLRRRAKAAA